jgi:subtilisin-like proprotein convertase family protein
MKRSLPLLFGLVLLVACGEQAPTFAPDGGADENLSRLASAEARLRDYAQAEGLTIQPKPFKGSLLTKAFSGHTTTSVFAGGGVGDRIPPSGTSGTTLVVANVPDAAEVVDLDINLNIQHTWTGDLILTLISPAGTRVLLSNGYGGGGDNFEDTTFDDEAGTPISSGFAPFTGSWIPDEALAAFDGEDMQGDWTLEVFDRFFFDIGTMGDWSLIIEHAPLDPEVKDDCKKGGWVNYGFKNQGQCVRFVETGKDSR